MNTHMQLSTTRLAVVLSCLIGILLPCNANAAGPRDVAVAELTVEAAGADKHSVLLLEFLASHNLAGSLDPDELIVRVERCVKGECSDVGYTRQALSPGQLTLSATGARLHTSWLGSPLDIRFVHRRGTDQYSGNASISVGSPKYVVEQFTTLQVDGRARLLGRKTDCPVDTLAGVVTGRAGQRGPVPDAGGADRVRALVELHSPIKCVPNGSL